MWNHSHQHELVNIAKQAKISNKQLQHILKQTTTMIQLIDQQIDDSNKYDKQSSIDIKNIKKQINIVIDGMIDKLKNQRSQLITSLDDIDKQREKVVTVRDGQDFSKAAMKNIRSYTDIMLRHGKDYDKVQQVKDIEFRLASISKAKIPSFLWSCFETNTSSHDMTVARVTMKTDVMEIEGMGGDVRGSVAGAESVSDNIVAKIPLIKQSAWVTGLEVMGQTVWVVYGDKYTRCVQPSSLYAYPVTSPHQPQTFPIQGLYEPTDMVRFPPGQSQLVISKGNGWLQWVNLEQRNGMWGMILQTLSLEYLPVSLGVCDTQLLVCDGKVIHVLSTSGEETHKVNMPQGVTQGIAVAQLTSPGFVIRDYDNKQVVLMTEKGEIQHTYQGQEGFAPADIVCHGISIYVTDSHNHHVDELSVDGRHVRQLIRGQGVVCPTSMCVDDTGRLYVVQGEYGDREVWVIKTKVTPTDTQATPGDRILIQQTNMNLSVTWCD